jgi:hypothetical protein
MGKTGDGRIAPFDPVAGHAHASGVVHSASRVGDPPYAVRMSGYPHVPQGLLPLGLRFTSNSF